MATVNRRILMVEIEAPDAETAAQRLAAVMPDATVWGEVDGVDAALLVLTAKLDAEARP